MTCKKLVASLLQLRVLAGKFNQQEAVFRLACQIALEMFEEKIRFNIRTEFFLKEKKKRRTLLFSFMLFPSVIIKIWLNVVLFKKDI